MIEKPFADTNILIYLLENNQEKAQRSKTIIDTKPVISTQVMHEMVNVLLGKFQWTVEETDAAVQLFASQLPIVSNGLDAIRQALNMKNKYRFSWWDALIVAAALEAGCTTLWSEDMRHGLVVQDRMIIRNPFVAHV